MSETKHDRRTGESTFIEAGLARVAKLARATGPQADFAEIEAVFRRIAESWGETRIGTPPTWPSSVGDDHTPFAWAIEANRGGALRLRVELLGHPPSLRSNGESALALLHALEQEGRVSLERLQRVIDLFLPPEPVGAFAVVLDLGFPPGGPTTITVRLNPQAQGPGLAQALTEEALVRLGFESAWASVAQTLVRRGPVLDELTALAIDLSPGARARVEIEALHHHATFRELAATAGAGASAFLHGLAIDPDAPLEGPPPATSVTFGAGRPSSPIATTVHVPIHGYAHDDREVADRIERVIEGAGLEAAVVRRAVEAFSPRPLADGIGVQRHVAWRHEHEPDTVAVVVSLAPELVRPGTIVKALPRRGPTTAEEIVTRFEIESLADHPFFRRLRREPPHLAALWKLIANAELGIVRDFSRRLAQVTARVVDDRIRSILAHQLNDELGHGDFDRAHSQLFRQLLRGLEPFRPAGVDEHEILAPGRALTAALEAVYATQDPYEGVGATMVIEIFGKQVDTTVGDEFRRQREVDPQSLEWLNLHEELEQDHANESLVLARFVPPAALASAWRGAERVWLAADAFFHGMCGVCFA